MRAWLLVGGAAAVLAGCGGARDADRAASASVAAGATGLEAGAAKPDDFAPPEPALGSGLDRIALLTGALDDDPGQEQIAAFRRAGSVDDPIRVGVIDYQDDGVSWRMIWEAETQALDPDTLQIALVDLVADPTPEIVVRGTAGSDRQTLDAYQIVPASQGAANPGAANQSAEGFRPIARIAVHGTLTIDDSGGRTACRRRTAGRGRCRAATRRVRAGAGLGERARPAAPDLWVGPGARAVRAASNRARQPARRSRIAAPRPVFHPPASTRTKRSSPDRGTAMTRPTLTTPAVPGS